MSQITTRINLSARTFPFVSANWGQTVMVPGQDQNFNRQVQANTDQDHDVGIPQAYYMHDVMPHAQGFQSIGYETQITAIPGVQFLYCMDLIDDLGNYAKLAIDVTGAYYIWEPADPNWRLKLTPGVSTSVYAAYCSGQTYIWQLGAGCHIYHWDTHALTLVTLTGLDPTIVEGIVSSFGYLIAWTSQVSGATYSCSVTLGSNVVQLNGVGPFSTEVRAGVLISAPEFPAGTYTTYANVANGTFTVSNVATATNAATSLITSAISPQVLWSSTIDPTDFVPSLITGAGGGSVEDAKGPIVTLAPHTNGFFVYTENNVVNALYSGNSRYPFSYKALVGSGGLPDRFLATQDANSLTHYAYTTSGLQILSMNAAQTVLPDVTDFISGKLFEDFDISTNTFTLTRLTHTMQKKLALVASRYLVISYGINELTHALIYDISTTRMGKIRNTHVFAYELSPNISGVEEISRDNLAFIKYNGQVFTVNFDIYANPQSGCLLLGKYQYVRARNLILDEFWLENLYNPGTDCTVNAIVSLDGKSISSISTPYLLPDSASDSAHYADRSEGKNISLLLKGRFHLESGVIRFNVGGKR